MPLLAGLLIEFRFPGYILFLFMGDIIAGRAKKRVVKNDIIAIGALAKADRAKGNKVIDGSIGVFLNEDGSLGGIDAVSSSLSAHICDKLGYPPSLGDKDYLEAIERWAFDGYYPRIQGLYSLASVQSLGGTGAISIAFNCFLERGGTVILPDPMWGNYKLLASKADLSYLTYPLINGDGTFDLLSMKEKVEEALSKEGRTLLIINDPCQNPTGYCLSESEYDALFDVLEEEGKKGKLYVLFDVAYFSYYAVHGSECRLIKKLAERRPSFLPLLAFSCSKVFALYGLRMGALFAFAPNEEGKEEISASFAAQARGTYSCPNGAGGYALSLALNDPSSKKKLLEDIEANKETLRERGEILLRELDEAGIRHYPYRSGFFLTIKVDKNAFEVYESLKAKHIYIVPLDEHSMRIALSGLSKEECRILVRELRGILSD